MGIRTVTITLLACTSLISLAEQVPLSAKNKIDSIDSYISDKSSLFVISNRTVDPFGQPQDPTKKEEPKTPKVTKTIKQEERILIEKEIVKLAKNINVLGTRMMIGSDSYGKRETITVRVKNKGKEKEFELKILNIDRKKIRFMNLTDGDNGIFNLDLENKLVLKPDLEGPNLNGEDNIIDVPQN